MVFTLVHASATVPAALLAFGSNSFSLSLDAGSSWKAVPANPACISLGGLSGVPHRISHTTLRNYGTVPSAVPYGRDYYNFTSKDATLFSLGTDGSLSCDTNNSTAIVFTGLPRAVTCSKFACAIRLHGGAAATLSDGTYLYSAIVYWGGGLINATSIVAFSSSDGAVWNYVGTVADASDYPLSQEGPNELALAVLSDNATVLCVFRLDAGDGPETHPYVNYALAASSDGGATWQPRGSFPGAGAGCARPKLMHLGTSLGLLGGVTQAPMLLSGGRWRTNGNTSDILMWVNGDGLGAVWSNAVSISAVHNSLAEDPTWHFSPAVNATSGPRETTSYTSLVALDQGISVVGGVSSRRVGITYNRHPIDGKIPPMQFIMPFTVQWE
jgi:hypothetical protein